MNTITLKDPFNVCWHVILDESKKSSGKFFSEKHHSVEDTRDADFNKVENRLAYMYKFGNLNIQLIEKCLLTFFDQCSPDIKNYFSGHLKICSLSNGPGMDMVGLLRALDKSNMQLKNTSLLQVINLYHSWRDIFHTMLSTAYQDYSRKYNSNNIPSENMQLIQCDIFSSFSPETQKCISSCDILLMFKVFSSTKATSGVFVKTIKKIFALLKPGSFVFFCGSKNNLKEMSTKNFMNNCVDSIFGPIQISIEKLKIDEIVSASIGLNPKESGKVQFIVLRKKNVSEKTNVSSLQDSVSKKKRKTRKKKNKNASCNISLVNGVQEDNDEADSEVSFISCSKQSDISFKSKRSSQESILLSEMPSENNINSSDEKKEPRALSLGNAFQFENNTASHLEKMNFVSKNIKEQPIKTNGDSLQLITESILGSENEVQQQNICQIVSTPDSCKKINSELSNFDEVRHFSENLSFLNSMPQHKNENITMNKESMQQSINKENKLTEVFSVSTFSSVNKYNASSGGRTVQNICTEIKQSEQETQSEEKGKRQTIDASTPLIKERKVEKKINEEILQNPSSLSVSCANLIHSSNKNVTPCKKMIMEDEDAKNESTKMPRSEIYPSLVNNIRTPKSQTQFTVAGNQDEFHSMLQHCETVITSLEKVVANVSADINSFRNGKNLHEKSSCLKHDCAGFRNPQCCVHNVNCYPRQSCRQHCNCKAIQNFHSCPKSECYRTCFNDMHNVETRPKPYIVMPSQDENLSLIVNLLSKKY